MTSRRLIPFYILRVLKNETDADHPLRAKQIQDRVNRLAHSSLIRKTETVIENIDMINQFYYLELDGNDLIGETTGFSGRYRGNKHFYYSERALSEDEVHFLHRMVMGQTSLDQKSGKGDQKQTGSVIK